VYPNSRERIKENRAARLSIVRMVAIDLIRSFICIGRIIGNAFSAALAEYTFLGQFGLFSTAGMIEKTGKYWAWMSTGYPFY